jgi:transketolase
MALGARLGGRGQRVYALAGDGECQEGSVWEAAYLATRHRLGNLTVIIDVNGLQQFGWAGSSPDQRLAPFNADDLAGRWAAFGWEVLRVDGNSIDKVVATLREAQGVSHRPVAVIARTVKGRGVPFMEGQYLWHGKAPSDAEAAEALRALGADTQS